MNQILRRRCILALTCLVLGLSLGCSGGMREGPPTEPTNEDAQYEEFKKMQESQGNEMLKGAPVGDAPPQ